MNELNKNVYVKSQILLPSLPLTSSSSSKSSLLPSSSSSLTLLLVPSKVKLMPIKRSKSMVKKNVEELLKQTENNYQNILLSSLTTNKVKNDDNYHEYDGNDDSRGRSTTASLMNSSLYISNNKLKQPYINQSSKSSNIVR